MRVDPLTTVRPLKVKLTSAAADSTGKPCKTARSSKPPEIGPALGKLLTTSCSAAW